MYYIFTKNNIMKGIGINVTFQGDVDIKPIQNND